MTCSGGEEMSRGLCSLHLAPQLFIKIIFEILIGQRVLVFIFLFFPPPRLDRCISWQQPLRSSGAGRALGSSSAEGIGLQAQKSLHTVLLILFCRVASGLRVLPVPCPDQRRCLSHPSLPRPPRSSLGAGEHQRSRACVCRYGSGFFGLVFCSFLKYLY